MDRSDVLDIFASCDAMLKGHFILSSGLRSDTYLQCARALMDTKRAEALCAALAEKIRASEIGEQIDLVVAPAMGGVVVGYEMGRQLNKETIFCERVDGVFTLRRGFEIAPGARVLIVEDVVTTGKSSLEAVACVEEHGGKVVAEACLIDRSNGTHGLPFPLYSLAQLDIATYSPEDLPPELASIPAVKPGSRGLK